MSATASKLEPGARARLGKLVGLLGSNHAGERDNALQALHNAGTDWNWLAALAADGECPNGPREKLLVRLVTEQLRQALVAAWAMNAGEADFVRDVVTRLHRDSVPIDDIVRALAIGDATRRRTSR